ncbi:unnamed protein product [Rotaria sordida]|uniref:USP domain-containing protein n=1 Tax=Rotaria sordida TaxID=392033 RepID=A0A818MZH8_9BILA|nr:unnamed protein product [Rotaria sordida]
MFSSSSMASDPPASDALATRSPLSSIQNQATKTDDNITLSSTLNKNNVLQKELNFSSSSLHNDRTSVRKRKLRQRDEQLDELNSSSSSVHNDQTPVWKHKSRDIDEKLDELNSSSSSVNNNRTSVRKQINSSSSSLNNNQTSLVNFLELNSSSSSLNSTRTSVGKNKSSRTDEQSDQFNSSPSSLINNRTSVRKHKSHRIDEELDSNLVNFVELNSSSSSVNNIGTSVHKHKSHDIDEELDELNSSSSSLQNDRASVRKYKSRRIDKELDDSSSSSFHNNRIYVRKHKSRDIDEELDELNSSSSSLNTNRTSVHKHESRHIDEQLDELNSSSSSLNNNRTSVRKQKLRHIDEELVELNSSSSSLINNRTSSIKYLELNSSSSSLINNQTALGKHKSHDIDEELDELNSSPSSLNNDRTSVSKHKSRRTDEELHELNSSSSSVNNNRTSVRKHKSHDIDEELDKLNSSSSSLNHDRTSVRKHKSRRIDEELDELNSSSSSRNNNQTSLGKHKSHDIDEELHELNSLSSCVNNDRTSTRKRKSHDIDEELDGNSSSSSINNDRTSIRKHKSRDIDEELDGNLVNFLALSSSLTSVTYNSSCSSKRKSNDIVEEIDGMNQIEEPRSKRLNKLCHHIHPLIESELKLEWSLVHVRGIGLLNKDLTKCLNLCYMNSVIQCLANTAPFVQWLVNEENHGSCELTRFDQLCSVCALRSIIMNIHPHIYNKSNLFCELDQASAFQIARRITELSSSFVPGQQEDPSEFLIVLLNHFMQCISSNDNTSFSTYLCNPLHSIFGINIKSSITCTSCQVQTTKKNYETIWSIPIISYYNLQEALAAFCSKEKLTGDNALQCSQCHTKTTALQSLQLANTSSIIIIHLKRFIYDQSKKLTRKLTHFISYPEFLNIAPYVANNNASEEVQKNDPSDESIYMLYAVIVHLGKTANNGHIFAYIRSPDNLWYKINDELVTSTDPKAVFSDNNSYVLWYTKLSEEKRNLYRKEINELFIPSSRISFSSTPIHRNVQTSRNFNDCSPISTNSISNISDFDDQSPSKNLRRSCFITNEQSPETREDVDFNHCSSPEDFILHENNFSLENNLDLIEYRTESRIEIIPKTNYKNQYPDYSNSPDTSCSSSSSQLIPEPLTNKSHISFRNDSNQLSDEATRLSRLSKISTG